MSNKLTYDESKSRLSFRTDIELCEEGFLSWTQKAKFFDKIVNDYFYCTPKYVLKNNSGHPKRTLEKRKQTNLKKYGKEFAHQTENGKEKIRQTLIKNHNIDNSENVRSKRFIIETDEHLKHWYDKQSEPKPVYCTLVQYFKNEKISLIDLDKYFENYKGSKSSLESLGEKLFDCEHYNKYVAGLNYRPDFKLSETVYVNMDGLYWHSEEQKDKKYHFILRQQFESKNLRIFQFRTDEIKNKSEIIKSIIDNNLGLTKNKIYARKCEIKIIPSSEAIDFLNKNHLMGSTNAKHVGLYYNNQLVSLLSYKEKKNVCKIERFCSLINYNIIGGFNKLLKYIECNLLKSTTNEVHNWVDLRYGTGNHLSNKGFKFIKDTLGWKWTDGKVTYNRLRCKANMDERKLTENEHAKELKWFRIFDAGQRLYIKAL